MPKIDLKNDSICLIEKDGQSILKIHKGSFEYDVPVDPSFFKKDLSFFEKCGDWFKRLLKKESWIKKKIKHQQKNEKPIDVEAFFLISMLPELKEKPKHKEIKEKQKQLEKPQPVKKTDAISPIKEVIKLPESIHKHYGSIKIEPQNFKESLTLSTQGLTQVNKKALESFGVKLAMWLNFFDQDAKVNGGKSFRYFDAETLSIDPKGAVKALYPEVKPGLFYLGFLFRGFQDALGNLELAPLLKNQTRFQSSLFIESLKSLSDELYKKLKYTQDEKLIFELIIAAKALAIALLSLEKGSKIDSSFLKVSKKEDKILNDFKERFKR